MPIKISLLVILVIAALLFGAAFMPGHLDPQAWQPSRAPEAQGFYARNTILRSMRRVDTPGGSGPESLVVDDQGYVYTGYLNGDLTRLDVNTGAHVRLINTGGRPLGLCRAQDGGLIIADAIKGLLHYQQDSGVLSVLVDRLEGAPLGFTNGVACSPDGSGIYFTDSSQHFPFPDYLSDQTEHRPHGRLLRYDVANGTTQVLLDGLYFANGVALGPDQTYVLVAETNAYRVIRYWLKGDKAGQREILLDNLPGFPDNLSYDRDGHFWLALNGLRNSAVDRLAPWPHWRKLIARLPGRLRNKLLQAPPPYAWVLAFDEDGKIVANLQDGGSEAYAPISSVIRVGEQLYFGSFSASAIGVLPAP